jgi:hypothetical protein
VEVYRKKGWFAYDPANGFEGSVPPHFLPVRRNAGAGIAVVNGVSGVLARFSIERLVPPNGLAHIAHRKSWAALDCSRLPLDLQEVLSLALLLPVGALVTAVLRNMVGLRTFGTFAPALLALSFIYAEWKAGLLVLGIVLLAGLGCRRSLERLRLLMVPRLSIVLTIVVVCTALCISFVYHRSGSPGAGSVLLPLVILTMMVERFHVAEEEDGFRYTIGLLVQTVIVSACSYLVLSSRRLGGMVVTYPELHFLTIAALVWIGSYTGYRLTELWRFRRLFDTAHAGRGSQ